MAQANKRTLNGIPSWQAVRVFSVKRAVVDPETGAVLTFEKVKKRLTGSGPTKTIAEQRLEEKVSDFRILMANDPNNADLFPKKKQQGITVNELLNLWLDYKQEGGRKVPLDPATVDEYERRMRVHIRPHLGRIRITSLKQEQLDTFIWSTLLREKRKVKDPETGEMVEGKEPAVGQSLRRTIYSILKQALDLAVNRKMIVFNPINGVERPAQTRMSDDHEARIVENHYIPRRIVKALWGEPELGLWILMFMGLRASERLGIELSSFRYLEDPTKPTELTVNRQLDRNRKTGEFFIKRKTKTRSGKRILILPDEVSSHLLLWKKQRDKWEKEGKKNKTWKPEPGLENLFFVKSDGTAIRPQKDRYAWTRLLTRLKLPIHREHDMRHMTATMLGKAGVNPSVVRIILGHSTVLMSIYYQHLDKADTQAPLEQVAEQFSKDAYKTKITAHVALDDDGSDEGIEVLDATAEVSKLLIMGVGAEGEEIDPDSAEPESASESLD